MRYIDDIKNARKDLDLVKLGHFSYKKTIIIGAFAGIFLFLTLGFLIFNSFYSEKIYPNIYAEGTKISGKNVDQTKAILEPKIDSLLNTTINIKIDDNQTEKFTYKELGTSYNLDFVINQAWQVGHQKSLKSELAAIKSLFKKQSFDLAPTIDSEKFKKCLDNLANKYNHPAKNAALQVENGQISLIPAANGQVLVIVDLGKNLNQAILEHAQSISTNFKVEKPKIDDTQAENAKKQAESWLTQPIILVYDQTNYTAGIDEISKWIKFEEKDNSLKATLDTEKIGEYIQNLSRKINTKPSNKIIDGSTNQVLEEGYDGQSLDKNNTIKAIVEALNQNLTREITLEVDPIPRSEKTVYASYTLGQHPGKYIEIDLEDQKLYQIEGNNLLNIYTVSSGKSSMATPTGTFSILEKDPKAYSAKYELYMPWWMAFLGTEYGIHALPEWPDGRKEGESHLGTPVSHGCVRLGDDAAKSLYEWADIGIPIIIHE